MKLLFGLALVGLTYTACSDDDDDDTKPATTNNNGGGNNNTNNPTFPHDSMFVMIASDASGDAYLDGSASTIPGGLDATSISFAYDSIADSLYFMVEVVDMASFSSSPSIDFNFILPNGTDGNKPLSAPFRGSNSHKSASVYTDDGGTAPYTYTYTNVSGFAANGIAYTIDLATPNDGNDLEGICSDCISLKVDEANNKIYCGMDRKDVISDSEVGASKSANITMSSNVGHKRGNNDQTTDGNSFSITIP